MTVTEVRLRIAGAGDLDSILSVCSEALGWSDREWDRSLFSWKHVDNPFGESLVLVAEDDTGILAVRAMMHWRWSSARGVARAARAVDTATRPDAQGRGLFRALTELSLETLQRTDVAFIFNTPNAKSRPGYLRMGWHDAGRIEFGFRTQTVRAIGRVLRSAVPATKRSIPTPDLGIEPEAFLRSLRHVPRRSGQQWRTDHSLETLLWRYADGPVDYRALPMSDSAGAIVRLRQRGRTRELLVAEQIGEVDERTERRALFQAMDDVGADHLIGAARTPGTITTSRVGPELTLREVSTYHPEPADLGWSPGDVELF